MDLSWPPGFSVNAGIPSDEYLNLPYKMRLPTLDTMAERVASLQPGSFMFKTDLSRGYKQLRLDPGAWPLMGFSFQNKYCFDTSPPFGLRSAAGMMQRTTEAVAYVVGKEGIKVFPYIDDMGGAEQTLEKATFGYNKLKGTLNDLGLEEAQEKASPPSTSMVWLGVHFDTVKQIMRLPEEKVKEVLDEVHMWQYKNTASRVQLQSLLGKLNFVCKTCKPARIFMNRILNLVRATYPEKQVQLDLEFKQDLAFFRTFLPQYNGIHVVKKVMANERLSLEVDACLEGCGGLCDCEMYGRLFPKEVVRAGHHISRLEMLNVVIACKLWSSRWAGKYVVIKCDNEATCSVLQTGRARDQFMQRCAREIWLLMSTGDFEINAVHVPGKNMNRADALSRRHTGENYKKIVRDLKRQGMKEIGVYDKMFELCALI